MDSNKTALNVTFDITYGMVNFELLNNYRLKHINESKLKDIALMKQLFHFYQPVDYETDILAIMTYLQEVKNKIQSGPIYENLIYDYWKIKKIENSLKSFNNQVSRQFSQQDMTVKKDLYKLALMKKRIIYNNAKNALAHSELILRKDINKLKQSMIN
jgi:hypothetical protein